MGVDLNGGEVKGQVGKVGLRTAQEVFQLWAWEFLEKSGALVEVEMPE